MKTLLPRACSLLLPAAALALLALALTARGAITEFPSIGGITINDAASATPYPSSITVSGVSGTVAAMRVKINGFTHTFPDDVDVFLVAPGGQVCSILSDAGSTNDVASVNLVFDDAAATVIPDATAITSGSYHPANYEAVEPLPPGGVGSIGTNLTALAVGGVNGVWKLFVNDDQGGDVGSIASWTVVIETFKVSNTNDSGAGSLRQAIIDAAAGDTITFAPNLSGQSIVLTTGQLLLNKNLTIDASSLHGGVTISGNNADRVILLSSGMTLTLKSLTIANGRTPLTTQSGGGIYADNSSSLTLSRCTLSGNFSWNYGGAINNSGTVTANQCTLSGNTAVHAGGAIMNYNTVTLNQCTLTGNAANFDHGGAIYNDTNADLYVNQSTLTGNTANSSFGPGGFGGGIYNWQNGRVTLFNAVVAGNSSTMNSGGADIENLGSLTRTGANNVQNLHNNVSGGGTASGPAALTAAPLLAPLGNYGGLTQTRPPLPGSPAIDAAAANAFATDQRDLPRIVGAAPDLGAVESGNPIPALTVNTIEDENDGLGANNISLRDAINYAPAGSTIVFAPSLSGTTHLPTGGQLLLNKNLTIDASALTGGITINGNHAGRIFEVAGGTTVALKSLTIINGTAAGGSFPGNAGGGIYNGGTLTVSRGTLLGNSGNYGGAIFNAGTLTVIQSTLTGNLNAFEGGAIYNYFATATVNQSTLAGNSGTYGGGIFNDASLLNLSNSIVGANSSSSGGADIYNYTSGTVTRTGGNIVQDLLNGGGTDSGPAAINAVPLLAPLGSYGGPIQTMALLPGSPARNAAVASTITSDQRGFPIVGTPDIGAYEAQIGPIAATTTNEDTTTGAIPFTVGTVGTLTASSGNTALVPDASITLGGSGASRTIVAAPALNQNGTATITVADSLSGETNTFLLTVTAVNDAPGFTKGANQTAAANAGALTVSGWATAMSSGPADESAQTLSFIITNNNNDLFSAQPAVESNGTLTFTPAVEASGTATVSVAVQDSGGNTNGGLNTSAVQTFTIAVTLTATFTVLIAADTGAGSLRDAIATANSGDTLVFAGALSGQTITLGGSQLLISKNLTIDGSALPGAITISGNHASRVFQISGGTTVVMRSIAIIGGSTTDNFGAGIYNSGTLTLTNVTISGNAANNFGIGGGIYNSASLSIANSTISGNHGREGGGIFNESSSTATLSNVTVTGNTSLAGAGGITAYPSAILTLVHCTIAGNAATGNPGGGISIYSGTLATKNTIIAGNTAAFGDPPDIYNSGGTITPTGANLIGNNSSVSTEFPAGVLAGTTVSPLNALLAPLGNYGGLTQTLPPSFGSPAIDSGGSTLFTTDQRGFPRVVGSAPDIGAYEAGTVGNFNTWINETLPATASVEQHANTFDFDNDGIPNIVEYAFGLNPTQNNAGQLPQPQRTGPNLVYSFTQPVGVTGITYGAEWNTSLTGNWTPVSDSDPSASGCTFSVPTNGYPTLFMRLKVTSP